MGFGGSACCLPVGDRRTAEEDALDGAVTLALLFAQLGPVYGISHSVTGRGAAARGCRNCAEGGSDGCDG